MDRILSLISEIARTGRKNPASPNLDGIELFKDFFLPNGQLDRNGLDNLDANSISRRELLTRFLLLSAVINQGPDIIGVRLLLSQVTNDLYHSNVRFLDMPLMFFQEMGIAIDRILERHSAASRNQMYRRPLVGYTRQSLAVRQACYRIFAVVIDFVEQYGFGA